LLMDSLTLLEQELRNKLDSKILRRVIEKTEAISYTNSLALHKSQKDLVKLQFFFIITTLLFFLLLAVFFRNQWLYQKRQMQISEKDKHIILAEKLRAEDSLDHAKELLNAYLDTIKEKTRLISHLESELTDLKELSLHASEFETITSSREKLMRCTILTEEEWLQFRNLFEKVYPGFSYRLKETYPELSRAEIRFLYLTKLCLSSREMATMLGISVEAIHKLRYRLRKKLNLEGASSFDTVLRKIDESIAIRSESQHDLIDRSNSVSTN
jgi:DNA-binding CsgD family transcriptional regulator